MKSFTWTLSKKTPYPKPALKESCIGPLGTRSRGEKTSFQLSGRVRQDSITSAVSQHEGIALNKLLCPGFPLVKMA